MKNNVRNLLSLFLLVFLATCSKNSKKELWIYTSLYNDVIQELDPILKEKFPDLSIQWFQSGSEKIMAKLSAEIKAGHPQADLLIISDPFYYELLKKEGALLSYKSPAADYVPDLLKDPEGYYATSRMCAMVMGYHKEAMGKLAPPTSFEELVGPKFANKIALGSPLESGTTFFAVADLSNKYGYDYFKKLRSLKTVSAGGNSAVLNQITSREHPIGVLLLENLLKDIKTNQNLGIIYPKDGIIFIPGPMAIMKNTKYPEEVKLVYDFFMGVEGQKSIVKGLMYSLDPRAGTPKGAKPLREVLPTSFSYDFTFVRETYAKASEIKKQFTQILFN